MGCLCSKATKYDDVAVPKLDATRCGPDVQLGVNNRLTGRGAALCNTTVLQDRMYFETRIVSPEGLSAHHCRQSWLLPSPSHRRVSKLTRYVWDMVCRQASSALGCLGRSAA